MHSRHNTLSLSLAFGNWMRCIAPIATRYTIVIKTDLPACECGSSEWTDVRDEPTEKNSEKKTTNKISREEKIAATTTMKICQNLFYYFSVDLWSDGRFVCVSKCRRLLLFKNTVRWTCAFGDTGVQYAYVWLRWLHRTDKRHSLTIFASFLTSIAIKRNKKITN